MQQAEQQQEASRQQLALGRRKLAAEAESKRVENERMLRMQVQCRIRVSAVLGPPEYVTSCE